MKIENDKWVAIHYTLKNDEGQQLFNKLNAVVARYLKLPLSYMGAIPQDQYLARSVMQQSPVSLQYPNAKSVKAFESIANQLMNPGSQEEVKQRGMAAFFSHIITGRKLSSRETAQGQSITSEN